MAAKKTQIFKGQVDVTEVAPRRCCADKVQKLSLSFGSEFVHELGQLYQVGVPRIRQGRVEALTVVGIEHNIAACGRVAIPRDGALRDLVVTYAARPAA